MSKAVHSKRCSKFICHFIEAIRCKHGHYLNLKKSLDKTKQSKRKYRPDLIKYELDTRINIFESVLCYELFAADNIKLLKFKRKCQGDNNTDIIIKTKA